MADLSPAAQTVLHEFWQAPVSPSRNVQLAAALRAAVNEVFPDERDTETDLIRSDFLYIAAELEGAQ